MVHLAAGFDVVVQLDDARLFGSQYGADFLERPGKKIAIVVEGIVGILTGVESAILLIGKAGNHPKRNAFRDFGEGGLPILLFAQPRKVQVIAKEFGIVVGHFLEVGDEPLFVDGVAVEAAGKLVVDAAAGHFFESGFGDGEKVLGFIKRAR